MRNWRLYKTTLILLMIFGICNSCASQNSDQTKTEETKMDSTKVEAPNFNEQLEIFKSLGYELNQEVTKELILREVPETIWDTEDPEGEFQKQPFSLLYYYFGWRNPEVEAYNFSEHCIWFDLEFFDPSSQYKWFMERMGAITNGEINFTDISIETDSENIEWITFKVNGIQKKWKLEKTGYIADSFVQRFSYLPAELATEGKYTYFDDGGQQWVIDYATPEEQKEFNRRTGLNREWLGEGNHFSEPKD